MANWSPFAPGTPGLVPITGPNGTFQVPAAVAPAFGVQGTTPPTAPLPTFAPEELAPPAPAPFNPRAPQLGGAPSPQAAAPAPDIEPTPGAVPSRVAAAGSNPPSPEPSPPPPPAPGSLGSQLANLSAQKDVARQQGDVASRSAEQEAEAIRAANEEEERLSKARDAQREIAQKEIAAARAQQATAMDAFVNHKVDQGRLWAGKSTGQKILAGIGVALSGIGGALVARDTGRPVTNPALDMIMGAIQDDVRLQMAEREKLGQVVGMRRDAVSDLRQAYSDGEAFYSAQVEGHARRTANRLREIAAAAKAPSVRLAAEQNALELDARADMFGQQAQAREDAARQQEIENRRAQSQLGLGWANYRQNKKESDRNFDEGRDRWQKDYDLRKQKQDAEISAAGKIDPSLAKEMREQQRDEEKRTIPGMYAKGADGERRPLIAKSEDEAKKLREQRAATEKILALVDENMRLMDKNGGESSTVKGDVWQKLKSNEAAILNGLRTLEKMGTLDASALEVGKQQLGGVDPASFVRNARAGYGQFRKQVLGTLNTSAQAQDEGAEYYDVPEATEKGVLGEAVQDPAYQAAFKRDESRAGLGVTSDALLRTTGRGSATEQARVTAGIDPSQQKALDLWIAAYSDPWAPPAKKAQAEKFIKGWAMSGKDPAVSAYAKARAKELGIAVSE